jgi:hypothetical protein
MLKPHQLDELVRLHRLGYGSEPISIVLGCSTETVRRWKLKLGLPSLIKNKKVIKNQQKSSEIKNPREQGGILYIDPYDNIY